MIEYRILGPLEVSMDGKPIEIGGPKMRALLALLLLRAGEAVPREVLMRELWGETPPDNAQHTLDVHMSRLRKILDPAADDDILMTRRGAYSLRRSASQLDADEFERLASAGKAELAEQPEAAAATLRAALSVWRGPVLVDIAERQALRAECVRLEELRLIATEYRIEADLALGRQEDVVSELQALVIKHPLRERLHGQLMTALYRTGRQAEALAAYQVARGILVEELGLDPSPALQAIETAVLRHDACLDLPASLVSAQPLAAAEPASTGPARSWPAIGWPALGRPTAHQLPAAGRRKRLLAVTSVVAMAAVLLFAGTSHGSAHSSAGPDTVAVLGAGRADLSTVVTGIGRPGGITAGAGAIWITDSADDLLLRLNRSGQVIDRIPVGDGPAGVTAGDGEVWVANELDGTVSEVNPAASRPVDTIAVGTGPRAIAHGYGSIWVANVTDATVSRISLQTDTVVATIALSSSPTSIVVGAGGVWVTCQESSELLRIDPADNQAAPVASLGQSPDGLAIGGNRVWIANASGVLSIFNPKDGRLRSIKVGGQLTGVTYADGTVWAANSSRGSVASINPRTGAVSEIRIGNEPTDVVAAGQRIWTTVLPSLASHRGGTLTVIAQLPTTHRKLFTDPAMANSALARQLLSMTNDGLVGYRRVAGLAGDQLVPDLATTLPRPTAGGLTYTFTLRRGLRYSDGQPVLASDFRYAIERTLTLNATASPHIAAYYSGLAGAPACIRSPASCDLSSGIVTNDKAGTVTFHLTAPDPDFLYLLAFSWAYPVPASTPDHPVSAAQVPATGPYLTKSLIPGRTWVLTRNPRFREWSAQAQPGGYPNGIIVRLDVPPARAVTEVERGHADVLLSPPPAASISQLTTRYSSQLHSGPLAATVALTLNTRTAPFSNLDARLAVNDALDRNLVVQLNGGPVMARATCQILPPTLPGYLPFCPYAHRDDTTTTPAGPNLAQGQQLVRESHTRGDKVTLLDAQLPAPFPSPSTARYLVKLLDQLGYHASLRMVSPATYYRTLGDSAQHVQAGFFSWDQGYPAPADFIEPLLTCGSFLPDNPNNLNTAELCDPRVDALARQAITGSGDPAADASRWAAVDQQIVNLAPWVPLYNPRELIALSLRVGNYQFHPYWDLLIDQLWVR